MADIARIRENMEVISSDGELVGHVASLDGGRLSVRSAGGGTHPVDPGRISRVDDHVHLLDSAAVLRGDWSGRAAPPPHPTEGRAKGPWAIGIVFVVILIGLLIWGLLYMLGGAGNDRTEPLPITGQGDGTAAAPNSQ
ncbi:MAG: DUF2171 domain-containing protein [Allosphingosinicella sp.]|uniref:DUF2171 domain-containing protein n=1 Tax=Allosphingosinicella sp. TaxID=2823234 RepID=UPI00395B652A